MDVKQAIQHIASGDPVLALPAADCLAQEPTAVEKLIAAHLTDTPIIEEAVRRVVSADPAGTAIYLAERVTNAARDWFGARAAADMFRPIHAPYCERELGDGLNLGDIDRVRLTIAALGRVSTGAWGGSMLKLLDGDYLTQKYRQYVATACVRIFLQADPTHFELAAHHLLDALQHVDVDLVMRDRIASGDSLHADMILRRWLEHDQPQKVRELAAATLGTMRFSRAAPRLAKVRTDDPDARVCLSAARALGEIATPASIEFLLAHGGVQTNASHLVFGLSALDDHEIVSFIPQILDNAREDASLIYRELGLRRNASLVTKIRTSLHDPHNDTLRGCCALALARLGDQRDQMLVLRSAEEATTPFEKLFTILACLVIDPACWDRYEAVIRRLLSMQTWRLWWPLRQDVLLTLSQTPDARAAELAGLWARFYRLPVPVVEARVDSATPAKVPGGSSMSTFSQGYAVIVAIANYPHVKHLPSNVLNDAHDLAGTLTSREYCAFPPGHVKLLLDGEATREGLIDALKWLAVQAKDDDTALFFFSGHGWRQRHGANFAHYVVPYDAHPDRIDETLLRGEDLTAELRQISAKRLLIVLDACHSGGAAEPKDAEASHEAGFDKSYYEELAAGSGRVVIASSLDTETSLIVSELRNSLFTHYFLEALRGKGRTRGDGLVRVFDLFDHVSEMVPAHPSVRNRQHPLFKAANMRDNFPVALCRSDKTAGSHASPLPRPGTTINRTTLRQKIVSSFRLSELETLCDDLDVILREDDPQTEPLRYDNLPGMGLEDKARELVGWFERRQKLDYLIASLRRVRPGLF